MPNRCPQSWRILPILLGLLFAMAAGAPFLAAQEAAPASQEAAPSAPEAAPAHAGAYKVSGAVSFGYRFVDVNGNQAKYNQLFNLQQGFRLFDGVIDIVPNEPGHGWFDRFSVSAQGLGGDPFPIIRADLRKSGVYELRTSYRATQYFYDLPQTTLTPHTGWIDRRRFADLDLRYTPTRDVRLHFFYNRTERAGNGLATSPFFYLPLGLNVWEAFGRSNTLPWTVPLREEANLFGAGIDYHVGKTNFHLEQSYRTFNSPANLGGFGNQPITLNGPLSPGANMVINKWNSFAGFNVPTTSVRVDQQIFSRLQLRAGYIYTHASGPTSLDGLLVPSGTFSLKYTGSGTTLMTTQTAEAGFTFKLFERMDFMSDYRYQILTERGTQSMQAVRSDFPTVVSVTQDSLRWDYGIHTLDTVMTYSPFGSLNIRAGVRFLKEDIVRKTNGQEVMGTQRSWDYSPLVNAAWTPSKKFTLRGTFESRVVVDPYVRITPVNTVGSTIRARFSLSDKWGIDNTWSFRNMKTDDIGFVAHTRSNSTSLWYQPLEKLGFQGGFTYGNFSSRNSIGFLQGVPPLTGLLSTDQTIDRTYFLGVKLHPKGSLTLGFNGQFIRSTGLGTFTGETSTYGPLTWPAFSAEIGYTFKKLGRTVLSWQHSYYLEDLFRATDYSATGFTLRFERGF